MKVVREGLTRSAPIDYPRRRGRNAPSQLEAHVTENLCSTYKAGLVKLFHLVTGPLAEQILSRPQIQIIYKLGIRIKTFTDDINVFVNKS